MRVVADGFVFAMAIMSFGAFVCYEIAGDTSRAVYWLGATIVTVATIFIK